MEYIVQPTFWVPYSLLVALLFLSSVAMFYRFIRTMVTYWKQRRADRRKVMSLTVIAAWGGIAVLLSVITYTFVFRGGVHSVFVDDRNGVVVRYRWTEESFSWDEIKDVSLITKTVSPWGVPISPGKWRKVVVLDTTDGVRVIDARGVNVDDLMLRLFEDIDSKMEISSEGGGRSRTASSPS